MKRLLLVAINFLWFFFAYTSVATAAPIAAAIAAIGSVLSAGGIAGAIMKAVIGVVLSIAGSLLQKALMKQDKPRPSGVKMEVQMGDDKPMAILVGRAATAGRRKYLGSWGKAGDTPNAYLTDVIELSNIPNRAGFDGLTSVWVDEKKVTIDWTSPHEDGRGYPVTSYNKDGTDYLWIKFYDGTQVTGDSFLQAKFNSGSRPWDESMIGRGCVYVIVTCRFNRKLFKNGLPRCIFEPKPTPMYDPRKDSTVGGSGAHRWDTPTTWTGSVNNAVLMYNIIRGVYYGAEWVYGGQNLAAHRLPVSNWMAAMNECDRAITLSGGGTEPQFRGGCEIEVNMEPLEVLDTLRLGCNGRLVEVGGAIKLLVGAPGAAVYSFTDEGILVTESQSFDPFPTLSSIHNGIEGTYPEPGEKWATKNAPPRYDDDLEDEDGNRRLLVTVDFGATPYGKQVQRLMRAMMKEERRFRTHQFYLPPDSWVLEPNDVVSWTSDRMGYSNKKFIVGMVAGAPTFCQLVTLKELDPTDYDWSDTFEEPENIGVLDPVDPPAQAVIGWSVAPSAVTDSAGTPTRPAILVTASPDQDDVRAVRIQARVKSTGALVLDTSGIDYEDPWQWLLSGAWCVKDTEYEVRGTYLPFTRRDVEWSAWMDVTTPDISETASVLDESITSEKIADGAVEAAKIADSAVTAIKLAPGAVDATKLANNIAAPGIGDTLPATPFTAATPKEFYLTADKALYVQKTDGSGWIKQTDATLIAGTIVAGQIAAGAIGATQLAAKSITSSKIAIGDYTNRVDNPNFGEGDKGWVKSTGGSIVNNPADAYIGDWHGVVGVGASGIALRSDNTFPVVPGEKYLAQMVAKAVGALNIAVLGRVRFMAADKNTLVAIAQFASFSASDTTYVEKSGEVTAPAGAVYAWVDVTTATGTISVGQLNVGFASCKRRDAAELVVDGGITALKIATNAIYSRHIVANQITAKELLLTDFENLAADGFFNPDPATANGTVSPFWVETSTILSGMNIIYSTDITESGKYAGKLSKPPGLPAQSVSVDLLPEYDIPIAAGEVLYGEMGYRGDIAAAGGVYFRIHWYDASKANISSSDFVANGAITTSFQTVGRKFTAPANTKYGRLKIFNHSGNTTGAALIIGHIMVRRAKAANLIVDGGIVAASLAVDSVTTDKIILGGVTTTKLGAGAVTVVNSVYATAASADCNGTTVQVASTSIAHTADADAVEVQFNAKVNQSQYGYETGHTNITNTTITIKRGSTVIATRNITDGIGAVLGQDTGGPIFGKVATRPNISISFSDTGLTGTSSSYTVEANSNWGGTGTVTLSQRYLQLMATKR